MKSFVGLIGILLLAVLAAQFLVPVLHKNIPSDFSRTQFLLETFHSEENKADAYVFGNSIAMSGIDASLLSDGIDAINLAYNFASNGQYLNESMLFYPLIPDGTKMVFQLIRSTELEDTIKTIDPAILRNFYFGGYPKEVKMEELFQVSVGLDYLYSSHRLELINDHRGVLINGINNGVRSLVRKDLNLEALKKELFFPNVYTNKISQSKLDNMIAKHNPAEPIRRFHLHEQKLAYFNKVNDYFGKRGIQFVLVILPYNPVLNNYDDAYKSEVNIAIKKFDSKVMSLINVLEENRFIDHCHLSKEGGRVLTEILIEKFNAAYAF